MERVTDTNKAEGVRSIHDTMLAKQHLCHGVHEHRQQSHRLDLIEELPVALRPVRMGEGVLVIALDSLKLILSAADPKDPGEAHKVSQSVRVVTWHVDIDVGDLVIESSAIALDEEFDNAFAARGGPKDAERTLPQPGNDLWRQGVFRTAQHSLQEAHPGIEGIS